MGKLFGTDGIRGLANKYPMTSEIALKVGIAVASVFKENSPTDNPSIIIGKDTRISGDMIEHALVSGICSMGVDAFLVGVLPTPGIAHLTSSSDAVAGIVISASHNPYYDNGIKVFGKDGYKPSEEMQESVEKLVLDKSIDTLFESIRTTGKSYILNDANEKYGSFITNAFSPGFDLQGMKIVIDCANGATYKIAPRIFNELGADVISLFIHPDGKNINEQCGSQHPETLSKKVIENNADIGLAFDGDGDRLIAVDEKGDTATGDQIIAVCAAHAKQLGKLKNNLLVTTVMSNMGLGVALKNLGIDHAATKVGDRHVMEKMIEKGAVIGGEDSGHMIFLDHHTTGDGIFAALKLLEVMKATSKPFSELKKIMTIFPQKLINLEVKNKPEINTIPEIVDVIKSVEEELGDKGRVLVRYSGTQPMCRVMVEGPTEDETAKSCQKIADVIGEVLG